MRLMLREHRVKGEKKGKKTRRKGVERRIRLRENEKDEKSFCELYLFVCFISEIIKDTVNSIFHFFIFKI